MFLRPEIELLIRNIGGQKNKFAELGSRDLAYPVLWPGTD